MGAIYTPHLRHEGRVRFKPIVVVVLGRGGIECEMVAAIRRSSICVSAYVGYH